MDIKCIKVCKPESKKVKKTYICFPQDFEFDFEILTLYADDLDDLKTQLVWYEVNNSTLREYVADYSIHWGLGSNFYKDGISEELFEKNAKEFFGERTGLYYEYMEARNTGTDDFSDDLLFYVVMNFDWNSWTVFECD